jgi:hypothetical protein
MEVCDVKPFEAEVLQEAAKSPLVALMRLSLEIDRQLRLMLAVVGGLSRYDGSSPVIALDILSTIAGVTIPREIRSAIADFWRLRNSIVHGNEGGRNGLALRGIDYGLRILKILASIPRPAYVVRYSDIPLYMDSSCQHQRPGVWGVILESFSADGVSHGLRIHPSTLRYAVGDEVSWEWKLGGSDDGWGETWYRNVAKGNAIELAWSGSLEFRGRRLSEV